MLHGPRGRNGKLETPVPGSRFPRLTAVVGEHARVARAEVERARRRVAYEDRRARLALVEVEPLLRLSRFVSACQVFANSTPLLGYRGMDGWEQQQRTLGCQCSSRSPPGDSVTTVAAMVLAAGNVVLSMTRSVPPSPGTSSSAWSAA